MERSIRCPSGMNPSVAKVRYKISKMEIKYGINRYEEECVNFLLDYLVIYMKSVIRRMRDYKIKYKVTLPIRKKKRKNKDKGKEVEVDKKVYLEEEKEDEICVGKKTRKNAKKDTKPKKDTKTKKVTKKRGKRKGAKKGGRKKATKKIVVEEPMEIEDVKEIGIDKEERDENNQTSKEVNTHTHIDKEGNMEVNKDNGEVNKGDMEENKGNVEENKGNVEENKGNAEENKGSAEEKKGNTEEDKKVEEVKETPISEVIYSRGPFNLKDFLGLLKMSPQMIPKMSIFQVIFARTLFRLSQRQLENALRV